ncbi:hypothetical protein C9I57_17990 [Trinickia symbiotica]|uniref:Uncharacterized protein n=1 Tax=Trinickia symbiotica TaxID=863227 RepID=A0A2T3XST9_9BURK|nr:hypothetical protein C9I57_17990 [Trinickia symbiotica]
MSLQQIERLVPRLEALLSDLEKCRVPVEDQLWAIAAISEWLQLSVDTVSRSVVTRPGFPRPVQPVPGTLARRRWFAGEVIRWARQNRGKLPARRAGRLRRQPS